MPRSHLFLLLGAILASLFWLVDAFIFARVFNLGEVVFQPREIVFRTVLSALLVGIGLLADVLIASRSQAQRDTSRLERRMLDMLEATVDLVVLCDRDGKLVYANTAAKQSLEALAEGGTPAAKLSDLVNVSSTEALARRVDEIAESANPWRGDVELRGRGGSIPTSVVLQGHAGPSGDVEVISLTARDISEHVLLQRALAEARDQLEVLVQQRTEELRRIYQAVASCNEAICIVDRDGRTVYQNEAFEQTYGYDARALDAAGGLGRWLARGLRPNADAEAATESESIWPMVKEPVNREAIVSAADGKPIPSLVRVSTIDASDAAVQEGENASHPVHGPSGNGDSTQTPAGWVVVLSDITDQREAQRRNAEMQDQLAHAARVNTLGELASSLGHELNQPLLAIANYASASLRTLRTGAETAEIEPTLEKIASQSQRAGEIIRSLRNLVRREPSQRSEADINDLVRDTIPLFTPQAERHNIAIDLELTDDLPAIELDAVQIQQVILNLATNGIEAMLPETTGRKPLTGKLRLRIATSPRGGRIAIAVSDNGPGVDAAARERIFQSFYTTKNDGIGMGLAISRSIVEAHGGRLECDGSAAGGACFTVLLPLE